MTRTLFVTNDFPPRVGGIETFVRSLCDQLPASEVVVYTARMPGAEAYDAGLSFTVHRDAWSMLLPTPGIARRTGEVMQAEGCTRVVFGAAAPLGLLAPHLRRAGAEHVTAITHGHEAWWARLPGFRQLLRRIGDGADEITFVSQWCHDRIRPALSPAAQRRMRPLVPKIDRGRFHPDAGGVEARARLGIPAEAPVVVCVARMVRRKGQDTLVKIWREVLAAHPRAVLLLVGDGPARSRVERMVRRRGLGESVVFAGAVAANEVPALLDAGDVFAMPCRSRWFGLVAEAFGIVYVEAAACGLRVVGGRSGGAQEAVSMSHGLSPPRSHMLETITGWQPPA